MTIVKDVLRIPAIGVTLVHRSGYFAQSLDAEGRQLERPETWSPEACLRPLPVRVEVPVEGRAVRIKAWRFDIVGGSGWVIPLVLLDTDVPENAEADRHLTDWLYGGDDRYRLAQEVVLGVGGVRMLRALGHLDVQKVHLNEGHMLRQAASIPVGDLLAAHGVAKRRLVELVRDRTGRALGEKALTIGFARRATQYKRADLVFSDLKRLRALSRIGKLQLVFAGKAHPRDGAGKEIIQRIARAGREVGGEVPVVYIENYDVELAKVLVSGADLWLNTPRRPLEASGTSGMKAAHNGVPSLSVLDGWWIEGHVEGVTGWSIGGSAAGPPGGVSDAADAEDLYAKLAVVLQLFHGEPERWGAIMRMTIALNASFFNTHRMVQQYASSAYMS